MIQHTIEIFTPNDEPLCLSLPVSSCSAAKEQTTPPAVSLFVHGRLGPIQLHECCTSTRQSFADHCVLCLRMRAAKIRGERTTGKEGVGARAFSNFASKSRMCLRSCACYTNSLLLLPLWMCGTSVFWHCRCLCLITSSLHRLRWCGHTCRHPSPPACQEIMKHQPRTQTDRKKHEHTHNQTNTSQSKHPKTETNNTSSKARKAQQKPNLRRRQGRRGLRRNLAFTHADLDQIGNSWKTCGRAQETDAGLQQQRQLQ